MTTADRAWHVLLIGGASGVGKTSVVSSLGQRFGVNVTQLDDIQTALETVTTPEQQPLLHFWRTSWPEFSAFTDAQHVAHFLDLSRQVFQPVLAAVVGDRLDGGMPAIIEGDFILPELAAQAEFAGRANGGRVRALFVQEEDERQIAANVVGREAGDGPYDASLPARTSRLKAQWLEGECRRRAHRPSRPGRGRRRRIEPSRRSRADALSRVLLVGGGQSPTSCSHGVRSPSVASDPCGRGDVTQGRRAAGARARGACTRPAGCGRRRCGARSSRGRRPDSRRRCVLRPWPR